ncbi:radical SAM/SPASM domain-containing protein [Nitratidesulfovibrio sp. 1201_IL3209]|uniref:radical SAM/SPASM domain-containing protein n=1 Tax=Nitratidesulfovibrio sp. 1201_IL3209 TaxID=3084053 RepID=UPI002FD9025B
MFFYYLLTQRCNLACGHCIRGKSAPHDMDTRLALRGMDELSSCVPNGTLVLTGGEPTLHPDFMLLASHALKCFNEVILTSNGTTPLYAEQAEAWPTLQAAGLHVQFSIDGDEQAHDLLRGAGSWHTALEHLELLSQAGVSVWVSTVVTQDNIASMPALREELHRHRVRKWHISPVLPFGCGAGLKGLSIEEWNAFVEVMLTTCRMRLGIRRLYDFTQLDALSDDRITEISQGLAGKPSNRNCGSGITKIYVYPDFSVYGCSCLSSIPFGDLSREPLQDILGSPQALRIRDYRVDDTSPCRKCRYLPLCNGGCIGISLHKAGRLGIGDIRCPLWQRYASEDREQGL